MFANIQVISCVMLLIGGVWALHGELSDNFGEPYVSSTARLLLSRGYLAVDHYVDVQNGAATLSLIRATNPKIGGGQGGLPGKDPVLFVHGILSTANAFISNEENIKPKDYSSFDFNTMSTEKLHELLEEEPASQSLVFTALNFGHEVWLLNRRPTLESQFAYLHNHGYEKQFTNFSDSLMVKELKKLVASDYWNFSFDEQAENDIPEIVQYVLEVTGREKLAYVGHSAGSVLFLMSLIVRPDITDKISKAVLWAPALHGRVNMPLTVELYNTVLPLLVKSTLPVPPPSLIRVIDGLVESVCGTKLRQTLICDPLNDMLFGEGSIQQMIENYNSNTKVIGHISSHEAVQTLRVFTHGILIPLAQITNSQDLDPKEKHFFYDVAKIKLRSISLWAGNTDLLIPIPIMDRLISNFTVPIDRRAIEGEGISFNHVAFLTHKDVSNLLIIPSMKIIGSDGGSHANQLES